MGEIKREDRTYEIWRVAMPTALNDKVEECLMVCLKKGICGIFYFVRPEKQINWQFGTQPPPIMRTEIEDKIRELFK